MSTPNQIVSLDNQIEQWRSYVSRRQAIHTVDVAELEDHLREQVATLVAAGLSTDEAFLVAVNRLGNLDALSREFAREHSDRLWKQLVVVPSDSGAQSARGRTDAMVAFGLAALAAVLVKLPVLFGLDLDGDDNWYARNASFFVLPLLTGYFVWKRQLDSKRVRWIAAAFAVAAIVVNAYPFTENGSTEMLAAIHLPIALWLAVGIAYAGNRWSQVAGRMDFIRFSGELFIYYVLIALGGGLLMGFMAAIFQAIHID
ncbi:MAG: permease prefix domain 1-containing protein, partial [Gemmatimonadaceae bacterium]